MAPLRVAAFVAHSDDECLGPGATIARHVDDGDEVTVAIAADCRTARDPEWVPSLSDAARGAAAVLGVRLRFLEFGAMTLADNQAKLTGKVEAIVAELRPDVVYTHHARDLNTDHRAVAESVLVACRPGGPVRRLYAFETPSSTECNPHATFAPSLFVDVTATLDRKLAAMACYGDELRDLPHPRNLDALRSRAAYWGQHAGCLYAEPFVVLREIR